MSEQHRHYMMARRSLERWGFRKQADWPELLLAIVETAREIAADITAQHAAQPNRKKGHG